MFPLNYLRPLDFADFCQETVVSDDHSFTEAMLWVFFFCSSGLDLLKWRQGKLN